jgi:hypothetical protein
MINDPIIFWSIADVYAPTLSTFARRLSEYSAISVPNERIFDGGCCTLIELMGQQTR